jgi:phosphoribosylformylglycinamidine synthase
MSYARDDAQMHALYEAVTEVGLHLAPALSLSIPVGKDSLSMSMRVTPEAPEVISPLSLTIAAFAKVPDVRQMLLPYFTPSKNIAYRVNVNRDGDFFRLGGSILAQVLPEFENLALPTPNLNKGEDLKAFFELVSTLNLQGLAVSYHDISDGGAITALLEIAFASRVGVNLLDDSVASLFAEELGGVIVIEEEKEALFLQKLQDFGFAPVSHKIANFINESYTLTLTSKESISLTDLQRKYGAVSQRIRLLRDEHASVKEWWEDYGTFKELKLVAKVPEAVNEYFTKRSVALRSDRPQVAILREQGINGHREMAHAFMQAGFTAIDVTTSEVLDGRVKLDEFCGVIFCGGFSFGDVLGAGRGWALSILEHPTGREHFANFFARQDTFTLGVCNGCQALAHLKELIPGTNHWPTFLQNKSRRFEARLVNVEVLPSKSIFLKPLQGMIFPLVVSHGEGRVTEEISGGPAMRYVDSAFQEADRYPSNPNGSVDAAAGFTSEDGRVTIMMPHPERVLRSSNFSYLPPAWQEELSPWLAMFYSAYDFVTEPKKSLS